MDKRDGLRRLIDEYWSLAYAEGKEGRTVDTPAGDAQRVSSAIDSAIADLLAERDKLAAELDEARRDAERWRLVRSNTVDWCVADERYWMVDWCRGHDVTPEQLDAAVDVAMAAREGK